MPFLVPAVTALAVDCLIVWLHHVNRQNNDSFAADEDKAVYRVKYLMPLAVIRLIVLCIPLLFHSYTGTAIQCASCYPLLYTTTLAVVILHMLLLCVTCPTSLEAMGPTTEPIHMAHWHTFRIVWWSLLATVASNVCHWILYWHVRSTAPSAYSRDYLWPRTSLLLTSSSDVSRVPSRPTLYYALRRTAATNPTTTTTNNHHNTNASPRTDEPPLLQYAMNDFMSDVRQRLRKAQLEWTARLEDFTTRLSLRDSETETDDAAGNHGPNAAAPQPHPNHTMTPFRVMLKLFAYEDVLSNGQLDAVFQHDHGQGLTFMVPQLLTFLLHNALYCSPQLEAWILQKCRTHLPFAQKCFWFLRAWCCVSSSRAEHKDTDGLFLDEPMSPSSYFQDCGITTKHSTPNNKNNKNNNNTASLSTPRQRRPSNSNGLSASSLTSSSSSYLIPEEREMIERLLDRVREAGNEAARIVAYGSSSSDSPRPLHPVANSVSWSDDASYHTAEEAHDALLDAHQDCHDDDDDEEEEDDDEYHHHMDNEDMVPGKSAATASEAVQRGLIPASPRDSRPSYKHFESLAADRRQGLLPQSVALEQLQNGQGNEFDDTIQFLDSLLHLADDLFLVPRHDRKATLKERLIQLECDYLPSNSIYMPVQSSKHRVWRIVASESIAISTKERVPCIICLEVVDYGSKRQRGLGYTSSSSSGAKGAWKNFLSRVRRDDDRLGSRGSGSSGGEGTETSRSAMEPTEAELVHAWRTKHRHPHRRSPFLHKVSATVQNNVQVMQDQFQQYRDRSFSEEMQYLKESLVAPTASTEATEVLDMPDEILTPERKPRGQGVSRNSSGASLASMGQWSSPFYPSQQESQPPRRQKIPEGSSSFDLEDSRRRIDRDVESQDNNFLRYGSDSSDQDREDVDVSALSTLTRPTNSSAVSDSTKSTRAPPVVFREDWKSKQERIRATSAYGAHPGWRLLPILVKSNDDLRQEQLASQLIYKMAAILAREKVGVWLCNYEILALAENGGIIEAIPDTISLDSLKKNDSHYTGLRDFFHAHFTDPDDLADAKANFIESLAAYSMVCFLLQIKDRHNGNILLTNRGHIVHIDFGFFFLSSPGKNAGFESAPFKLTREFVELMDGPNSFHFRTFRDLCVKTFIALRRHCMELILLVEMVKTGNEQLKCFRGRPDQAIQEMRNRFRLDLNDRACREYVHSLVDDSIENWRTDWYDRYQRYFVGVL